MPFGDVVAQFGDEALVKVSRDTEQVHALIEQGVPVTDAAIQAACYIGNVEALQAMLATTTSPGPDCRLSTADIEPALMQQVAGDWASRDISPNFGTDKKSWYALQHAATGTSHPHDLKPGEREERGRTTTALLGHNPDLYKTFVQPLWHPMPFPFPGEPGDLKQKWWCVCDIERKIHDTTWDRVGSDFLRKPIPESRYGLRSVLHSLFEDEAYSKPFLDLPELRLGMDRRDPQGRMLLHSTCRNAVGADAAIDAIIYERSAKIVLPTAASETNGRRSIAVDHGGKTILHHLLETRDCSSDAERTPCIRNTLIWILEYAPTLINQPDSHGTYPLHTALQGLRRYPERYYSRPVVWAQFDEVVQCLLEAGADACMADSRGNTALHYLADSCIGDAWQRDNTRKLFKMVLDGGIDVNARNSLGRTMLEMLFDEDEVVFERHHSPGKAVYDKLPSPDEIDRTLLGQLDAAGVEHTGTDPGGNTLLHLVARHPYDGLGLQARVAFRTNYVLSSGIEPNIRNAEGKTAVDVAKEARNHDMLEALGLGEE